MLGYGYGVADRTEGWGRDLPVVFGDIDPAISDFLDLGLGCIPRRRHAHGRLELAD